MPAVANPYHHVPNFVIYSNLVPTHSIIEQKLTYANSAQYVCMYVHLSSIFVKTASTGTLYLYMKDFSFAQNLSQIIII